MKLTHLLSTLSLVAVVTLSLALAINVAATAAFAVAVGLLLLATVVSDYSARPHFVRSLAVPAPSHERHPLAA